MRIDLHIHSTASDGALTPGALVEAARAGGLDVMAITDHDTTAGVAEAVAVADGRPRVIPGIEVSSTHGGEDLHFLGYFVQPDHPALQHFATEAARRREDRMAGMVRKLANLGVHISYEDVLEAAGDSPVGRPHLARALVQAGHVRSVAEAFALYIADGGPAFLPTELLTPREAIELIHSVGGIAVWAHPPMDVLAHELRHFVDWGLEGLECYRPTTPTDEVREIERAARTFDLLQTGGSDWHGPWSGPLGAFYVAYETVADFLAVGGIPARR